MLAAFIVGRTNPNGVDVTDKKHAPSRSLKTFNDSVTSIDILAVIKVMGRRCVGDGAGNFIQLYKANLYGVDFTENPIYFAKEKSESKKLLFRNIKFEWCLLSNIIARNCDFESSYFVFSDLQDADFIGSNCTKTNFAYAKLMGADFSDAILTETNFGRANLTGTFFVGTDLSTCVGLTQEQINSANVSANTKLPDGLFLLDKAG